MKDVGPQKSSEPSPEESEAKGITVVVVIIVFLIGYFFFPAASSYWSDRGPRMLVLVMISGMAAGLVHLAIGMGKRSGESPTDGEPKGQGTAASGCLASSESSTPVVHTSRSGHGGESGKEKPV